jgi:AcrR family transcriptional regulator
VTLSLREQRKLRTRAAIAAAALELFAERGYDAVTVAEVAAAARVGERTLYRYFADKEDLLFAEDADWRAALQAAIDQQPAGAAPFTVLRRASATVTRALEERREEVRRRGEVIANAPALSARERAKHAAWEEVLAKGLRERGAAADEARLLGRIAVACYDEALTRWLAQAGSRRTLAAELDATFAQAAALAT